MRRPRLSDERGFTLIELLAAMTIGLIVLLSAFMVLDRSFSASGQIADRSDALQRGRQAMDLISQQLRSQICLGKDNVPITFGNETTVTFYANLGESVQNTKKHTLEYDPSTKRIRQLVVPGSGTFPAMTFTGAATNTVLLTNVERIMDGSTARPVFRYFGYVPGTPDGALEPLPAPLSTTNLSRVAVIKIGFRAFPFRSMSNDRTSTVLENDVYVRPAVPSPTQAGPLCV